MEQREKVARASRDNRGRYISTDCPECGYGTLKDEGGGYWRCDGLADPGDVNKPLVACTYAHFDGEPRAMLGARP